MVVGLNYLQGSPFHFQGWLVYQMLSFWECSLFRCASRSNAQRPQEAAHPRTTPNSNALNRVNTREKVHEGMSIEHGMRRPCKGLGFASTLWVRLERFRHARPNCWIPRMKSVQCDSRPPVFPTFPRETTVSDVSTNWKSSTRQDGIAFSQMQIPLKQPFFRNLV